jgi:hypothetical protein
MPRKRGTILFIGATASIRGGEGLLRFHQQTSLWHTAQIRN